MRLILPLLFGLGGAAILIWLGLWQLDRRDWKEGLLARIETRIADDPIPVPETPNPETDDFAPVTLEGAVDGRHIRVFGAWRAGTGYRIVAPVLMGDRRIMVDFGIVPLESEAITLPQSMLAISGNLLWPDETGSGTPIPSADLWYSRDVPQMASYLETEPVLIVARSVSPELVPIPAPVGTDGIPNNHLGYAIQWFGLALVWLGMTAFLLWRMTRRTA